MRGSSPTRFPDGAITPALEVREICKSFGGTQVLRKVSFNVPKGCLFVIMGGSGCGKSTLLNILTGWLPSDSGQVSPSPDSSHQKQARQAGAPVERGGWLGRWLPRLRGVPLPIVVRRTPPPTWQEQAGVLYQHGALLQSLTVAENIALPLLTHRRHCLDDALLEETVARKLKFVGLMPHDGSLLPGELSGGMRKRAALARALALDPDLLFCDEPTSGLDPAGTRAFDELLRRLQHMKSGSGHRAFSAVVVTHDLASFHRIADRGIVLGSRDDGEDRGSVLVQGTHEEIVNCRHPAVQRILAEDSVRL